MDNCRWLVIKNNVPVQMCSTIEEAEAVYCKYDGDEIRRVDDEDYEPPLMLEPRV